MPTYRLTLVDPALGDEERARLGIGPDPLVATEVRRKGFTLPWKVAEARQRALRQMERPYELVEVLIRMHADAVRFRDLAASQSATAVAAADTARSLAWLLWHTANRIDAIAALREEVLAAGAAERGSAKATWVAEQEARMADLWAPVERAAADVRALAALAEETAYAAKLAMERDPTVELAAPTAREIGAADDIDAAADSLTALRSAWTDLDTRLREL